MKHLIKHTGVAIVIALMFILIINLFTPEKLIISDIVASVFFQNSVETEELVDRYEDVTDRKTRKNTDPIKVLIVPGHDEDTVGTMYGSVTEQELNLKVGKELNRLLEEEEGIETFLTRDDDGYNPELQEYLDENLDDVFDFRREKKEIMDDLIEEGRVDGYVNIQHNSAPSKVVGILYGINKFANDNEFDIAIHIHFNDHPGRYGSGGKYNGFSIYIPEKQFSNADASMDLARKVRSQFEMFMASSDLKQENAITEDQELIAIGSYNTADFASLLIEYGYIYESQFTTPGISDVVLDHLAEQTYVGIMNYLSDEDAYLDVRKDTFSTFSDYKWSHNLSIGDEGVAVLALQDRLNDLGYYSKSLNQCPINGNFGNCTKQALIKFQKDNGLTSEGYFGNQTREILNNI